MEQVPLPRWRSAVTVVVALALAAAMVALAGPAEAGRRPPPKALRATADQTSLTVRWHRVRKAPGYRVRWSVNRSMAGSHRIATARHRVRIGGLAPDTRYFVQVAVAARHGHGRRLGPWSRVLARRTSPPPCPTVGNLGDPTPAVATHEATDLRVASFNIRTMNFDSTAAPTQMWVNRADLVASLLLGAPTTRNAATAPPDVIALQEANQSYAKFAARCTNQMIDLRNRLDVGSGRHFEATSLDPASSVGTRILFDTTRLRLERAGSVLLAPASTDHPHLAWAVFQVRNGGQEFFFGSVHLAPGEGPVANALRNSEWDLLVSTLQDTALTGGLPVVLAGDFNSPRSGGGGANTAAQSHIPQMAGIGVEDSLLGNPTDPADKTLTIDQSRPAVDTPGYLPVNAHCASFNGFQTAQRCEDDPTLIGQQIDYVFASNDLPVTSWEMVLNTDPSDNWIGTIPSDHNLVRATVTLPAT